MPGLKLLQTDDFKARMKGGGNPLKDDFGLVKSLDPEIKAINENERTVDWVISTGVVDRHGDTVRPKGWQLKHFRKNPVVLWAHSHRDPPVAKAMNTKIENDQLISTAKFMDAEISGFADMIFRMIAGKFLKASSVGFIPLEFDFADDEDRGFFAMDIIKQELVEWSVVPVPANPETLVRSLEGGIDMKPMIEWCGKTLDEWEMREGILMPRDGVETLRTLIEPKKAVHHLPPAEQDALLNKNLATVAAVISDDAEPVTDPPSEELEPITEPVTDPPEDPSAEPVEDAKAPEDDPEPTGEAKVRMMFTCALVAHEHDSEEAAQACIDEIFDKMDNDVEFDGELREEFVVSLQNDEPTAPEFVTLDREAVDAIVAALSDVIDEKIATQIGEAVKKAAPKEEIVKIGDDLLTATTAIKTAIDSGEQVTTRQIDTLVACTAGVMELSKPPEPVVTSAENDLTKNGDQIDIDPEAIKTMIAEAVGNKFSTLMGRV